ncbi:MAG: S8 family serine peptidase [Eubacteriales bacterium]
MKKRRRTSKLLSFVMAIIVLSLGLCASISAISNEIASAGNKISDELKTVMQSSSNDDYIPIEIWLDSASDEDVYSVVSRIYDMEITAENEDAFVAYRVNTAYNAYLDVSSETVISENAETQSMLSTVSAQNVTANSKIQSLRNNGIVGNSIMDSEIRSLIENGADTQKIIEVEKKNEYLSTWRQSRKALNASTNESFTDKLDMSKCRNLFVDPLLAHVTLECKKSYIYTLSSMSGVSNIEYSTPNVDSYKDIIDDNVVLDTSEDMETSSTSSGTIHSYISNSTSNGYYMRPMEDTLGYTGAGVRVGVFDLSYSEGVYYRSYDTSNVHLTSKASAGKLHYKEDETLSNNNGISFVVDSHATKVLSILCGDEVTLPSGEKYKGIAPDATVYFAHGYFGNESSYKGAINWLVSNNVSVINISAGCRNRSDEKNSYNSVDEYFDNFVIEYRIAVVKSAGNKEMNNGEVVTNYWISSPGLAYNVITVGSMSNSVDSNGKYLIANYSSGDIGSTFTAKPDLCSFGSDVYMCGSNASLTNYGSGTSFAAPMVTATIALMFEAQPNLIGKPDTIKSILVANANQHIINKTNCNKTSEDGTIYNEGCSSNGVMFSKVGAGLLSINSSIQSALRNDYHRFHITLDNINSNSSYMNYNPIILTNNYHFNEGQKIEFALVYEKITNQSNISEGYEIDMDIKIKNVDIVDNPNNPDSNTIFCSKLSDTGYSNYNNVEIYEITFNSSGNYKFQIYFDDIASSAEDKDMYISLYVSCGCEIKDIDSFASISEGRQYYGCLGCGKTYYETATLIDIPDDVTYNGETVGIMTYEMKYRMYTLNGVDKVESDEYSFSYTPLESSSYTTVCIVDGGSDTGYGGGIRKIRSYEILVVAPAESSDSFIKSITIDYSNFGYIETININ